MNDGHTQGTRAAVQIVMELGDGNKFVCTGACVCVREHLRVYTQRALANTIILILRDLELKVFGHSVGDTRVITVNDDRRFDSAQQ